MTECPLPVRWSDDAAGSRPRGADYRRLFGDEPPPVRAVGFVADTDQTGASVVSNLRGLCIGERAARPDSGFIAPLVWAARARRWGVDHAGADSLLRSIEPLRGKMSPWDRAMFDYVAANVRGDHLEAFRAMKRVVDVSPSSEWVWQLAAAAYWINRPRETVDLLLPMDPERGWLSEMSGRYWSLLANALHRLGEHRSELEQVERWRSTSPGAGTRVELRALAALGELRTLERRLEERFREGVRFDRRGSTLRAVGRELEVHGHRRAAATYYARALEAFERVPRTRREERRVRNQHGRTLLAAGRWTEARPVYRELAAELPGAWAFRGRLGVIAARLGDREEALARSRELSRMGGPYSFGEHTSWRATIAAALGDREGAVRLFRQALAEGLAVHNDFHTRVGLESLRGYPLYEELMGPGS